MATIIPPCAEEVEAGSAGEYDRVDMSPNVAGIEVGNIVVVGILL